MDLPYPDAVEEAFGNDVDYAQLINTFAHTPEPENVKYSCC